MMLRQVTLQSGRRTQFVITEASEVMAILAELNRKGKTIVMVTHEADMAAYARRIVRFVDGMVAQDIRNAPPAGAASCG
mgnify:CR=1 FL=1